MASLSTKRIVVAGGSGDVGEGIVRRLLAEGAEVIVPARSAAKVADLHRMFTDASRLKVITSAFGTVSGAQALADEVAGDGVDAVIDSIGGWWQGRQMVDVDEATWDELIANNLTSHFAVARAFVPLLEAGGTFVQILGGAASAPIPKAGLVSVTAAAVAMMGRVVALEAQATSLRFHQLQINSFVATRGRAASGPGWITADDVGDEVVRLITADSAHRSFTCPPRKRPNPRAAFEHQLRHMGDHSGPIVDVSLIAHRCGEGAAR